MRILRPTLLLLPLLLAGCGAQPLTTASFTPGPTATPRVIVVVVTATPSPPTATPEAAPTPEPSPTPPASLASPAGATSGAQQSSAAANPTPQGTFRICGTADPQVEKAIEQLIDGHNFSAAMATRSDGCADLTVKVAPGTTGNGSSTTNIAVGNIAIKIVSQNGVTTAHIGAGS